jgi:hypothetical protein
MTPENQTKAERTAELTLFGILLFGLPLIITSAKLSQPNGTELHARHGDGGNTPLRFDTGSGSTWPNAESASAAHSTVCWKCDTPGHLAHDCLHSGAIKGLVIKRNPASRSGNRNRRYKNRTTAHSSSSSATTAAAVIPEEPAGVVATFPTISSGVADDWLCDSAQ